MLVAKSCLTLCDHMDCSPPGSSVHGILQAGILEWVAISYSKGHLQNVVQTLMEQSIIQSMYLCTFMYSYTWP